METDEDRKLTFEAKLGEPEIEIKKCIETALGFTINEGIHCKLAEEKKVTVDEKILTRTPQSVSFNWPKTNEKHSSLFVKGVIKNAHINRLLGVKSDTECQFMCSETKHEWRGIKMPVTFCFWVRPKR